MGAFLIIVAVIIVVVLIAAALLDRQAKRRRGSRIEATGVGDRMRDGLNTARRYNARRGGSVNGERSYKSPRAD